MLEIVRDFINFKAEIVRDYINFKALKYRVMVSTVTELQARANELGLGAMTLTELAQLEYMGKEIYQLEMIAAETMKIRQALKKDQTPEPTEDAIDDQPTNLGQYL